MKYLRSAVFASALFPQNTPHSQRIKLLEPYFQPKIGSEAKLHPDELNHIRFKSDPYSARGFIVVTPPKGKCFLIERRQDVPDEMVCKKTTLSFRLHDMDYAGRLSWRVSTGKKDFGTKIEWHLDYRLAQVIPVGRMTDSAVQPRLVISCMVEKKPEPKIIIRTAQGDLWTIRIPADIKLLPQPEEGPNLFFRTLKKETNIIEKKPEVKKGGDEQKKSDQEPSSLDPEGKTKPTESQTEQGAQEEEEKEKAVGLTEILKEKEKKYKYSWSLLPRNTYELDPSNFVVDGSPRNPQAKCRLRFKNAPHDREKGLLECIYTGPFDSILLPLSCGQELEPSDKPGQK